MSRILARVQRDERGASLILAIAFMLTVGGIGAAVISSVTSGLSGRAVLDQVRNRQYAADAGVERAIAAVRGVNIPGSSACGQSATKPYYEYPPLNRVPIRVDCVNKLSTVTTAGKVFPQFNVIFTACEDKGPSCGGPTTRVIIRAQVNFEGGNGATNPATLNVTKTWVQSWSVNR